MRCSLDWPTWRNEWGKHKSQARSTISPYRPLPEVLALVISRTGIGRGKPRLYGVLALDALDHEGFCVCRAVANFRYWGVFG